MRVFIFIVIMGIFIKHSNGHSDSSTISAHDISNELISVSCAGGNSTCPNSETCCQLESGQYGCCPLSDAVCCSDHLHCCPNGYTCDVIHSRCQKGSEQSHDVVCPGDGISCVDGETCCQSESDGYGCCPLPDAVCCSDFSHCCPHGYRCNIEESKCEKGVSSIPWFTKKAATSLDLPKKSIIIRHLSLTPLSIFDEQTCPDGITKCSLSSTCCPNKNNDQNTYSCCPYAQGVCCGSNGSLCCPDQYICDEKHLTSQLNEMCSPKEPFEILCSPTGSVCAPPRLDSQNIILSVGDKHMNFTNAVWICCPTGYCCPSGRCKPGGGCA